jgi:hypothetical protein
MKNLAKSVLLIALPLILFFACKKDESKVTFKAGAAPALTSSATTLALIEADSAKQGVKLAWSNPNYSFSNTGGSSLKVGYTLEIDSTGKNFAKAQTISLTDILEKTYTVAEFNQLLLKIGLKHSVQGSIDVRVSSALYVASSKVMSNVVTLKVTPYNVKPKPVIPPPAKLFIIGDATPGGWPNPVPASQELTQIDENTFGTIIQLTGGKEYLLLPVNGDWAHKYSLASKTDPAQKAGGKFLYDAPDNFPGPTTDGTYKIIVSFLTGEYTVTPVAPGSLPTNLFIVGDATPGGWNNPVPVPSQQLTKKNDYTFELTLALTGGKNYLFLPRNDNDWSHKYAVDDNTIPEAKLGGTFKYDAAKDFPSPAESGNYKIVVSFLNNSYKLTKL